MYGHLPLLSTTTMQLKTVLGTGSKVLVAGVTSVRVQWLPHAELYEFHQTPAASKQNTADSLKQSWLCLWENSLKAEETRVKSVRNCSANNQGQRREETCSGIWSTTSLQPTERTMPEQIPTHSPLSTFTPEKVDILWKTWRAWTKAVL